MKRLLLWLLLLAPTLGWATVGTQVYTVTYSCTGGFGPFPFAFPISDPSALTVLIDGVVQPTTNYTPAAANNNYNNGGSVTMGSTHPCNSGSTLVISRVTPLSQTVQFYDNMPIPMKTFERGLDKLTEIVQEQWGRTDHYIQMQNGGVNFLDPAVNGVILDFNGCTVSGSQTGSPPTAVSTFHISCPGGGGGSFTAGGDLSGSSVSQTVIGLYNKPFDSSMVAPTNNYVVTYDSTAGKWKAAAQIGGGNLSNSGFPVAHQVGVFATPTTMIGVSPSTAGLCFLSNGLSTDPSFQTCPTGISVGAFKDIQFAGSVAGTFGADTGKLTANTATHSFIAGAPAAANCAMAPTGVACVASDGTTPLAPYLAGSSTGSDSIPGAGLLGFYEDSSAHIMYEGKAGTSLGAVMVTNSTNTGGTAMTLNMAASTTANAFRVPVLAGGTSGSDGTVVYDATAKSFHFRINGADAIGLGIASAPAGSKCLHTNGTTGLVTETTGDCGSGSGTVTSIATTSPITGGTITTTGTIACATCAIGPGTSTSNHLAKFSGTDGITLADGGAIPTGTVTSIATTGPIAGGTITSTGTISLQNSAAANVTAALGTDTEYFTASGSAATTDHVIIGDAQGGITDGTTTLTSLRTHWCEQTWGGSGTSFAMTSGDDAVVNNGCFNDTGVTWTITAMKCRSDAGSNSVTVHPTFGADGTGTTLCSGALTCGNSYAYSSSCTISNAAVASGKGFRPVMGGTLTGTTSIIVHYEYTTP